MLPRYGGIILQCYKNIIDSFFEKHIFAYTVLIISLFLSEFGLIFLFNSVGVLINDAISGALLRDHLFHELVPILRLLSLFIILRFLFKHLDFSLSNKGLIYAERSMLGDLLHKDYETIMSFDKIELAQQLNNDCVTIMDYFVSQRPVFWVTILKLAIILLIISHYSIIAFGILLCLSLLFIFVYVGAQKYYENLNQKTLEAQSDYFSVLGGELLNVFLVKINSWYLRTLERFSNSGNSFVKKSIRFLNFDFFLTNITKMLSIICMLGLPLVLIYTSSDAIASIFVIVTLIQLYFPALEAIVEQLKIHSCYKVAQKRLIHMIDLPNEHWGNQLAKRIDNITLDKITFQYKSSHKSVIQNFSYQFVPDHIYFIMGQNGSGKSTLLNLILGLLKPCNGLIAFNNIDLCQYDLKELREKKISYCEQEPYLIPGTIKDNLSYGTYYDEKRQLDNPLLQFVQTLPNGIDTEISAGSNNLSGGQKQRIALSRCFAKEAADILIFDEPTSALDKEGISDFSQMLQKYKMGRIIIVVTHDTDLADIADDILRIS